MWSFLLFTLVSSDCVKSNYFTECSASLTRDIIVAGSSDCGKEYPKIYPSQDCTFPCGPGTYLDITEGAMSCLPCQSGTYSIGGGEILGGDGESWESSLSKVISECYINVDDIDYYNLNCTGWTQSDNILISGETTKGYTYTAGLSFSFSIVKQGTVTVTYRKDTVHLNGYKVGFFSIFLNLEMKHFDDEIDDSTWKTITLPLDPGNYEFYLEYRTMKSAKNIEPHAYVSEIRVIGTDWSSTHCHPCKRGGNLPGSSKCDLCDFNYYWDGFDCKTCPNDKYSLKGSVGEESCQPRLECTENDYKHIYSNCTNSSRNLTYQWKEPILCAYQNYTLPSGKYNLSCETCKQGHFIEKTGDVTKCVACPDGKYISNDTNNKCENCTAGYYALKIYNYSDWTELPENFTTNCIMTDGTVCLDSSGWIPSTYYLTTGKNLQSHSEVFLNRYFDIESNFGIIKFEYEFINFQGGSLDAYVDGAWSGGWSQSDFQTGTISLTQGLHYVQWTYWPNSTNSEEIRIYSIKIHGSIEGGAKLCAKCLDGSYSTSGSAICSLCSPGNSSNTDNTGCIPCQNYYYSPIEGSKCYKCPSGTISNNNRTNCIATDYTYLSDETFYLGNITGRGVTEGVYTTGICDMPSSKLYCHQTFYGPLPGDKKNFYVSVMNPSQIVLPSVSYYFKPTSAFAYAVMEKKELTKFKEGSSDVCKNDKAVVSLGSIVSGVNRVREGLKIDYSQGDYCDKYQRTYNSSLLLYCDKSANIGWPAHNNTRHCFYEFVWKTKYGCPVCMFEDMNTIYSSCENGKRTYKKIEGSYCILPFDGDIEWTEPCWDPVLFSWPMLVAGILIGILLLSALVSLLMYVKYHKGYRQLEDQSRNIS
ncbi:hypothetical protein SteCoe_28345 [Stentor coeruleus]|uniref:MRH domain-containing protein n=1 Tax=Stentor coeruleus TaxID=5963 RepID=A0A1R2B8J4_9CILI|nr:hypothetical protein SteCoe_28345 [Stentor coeruleus]